jgi:hypothetical protein
VAFTPTYTWANDGPPYLNASNLNLTVAELAAYTDARGPLSVVSVSTTHSMLTTTGLVKADATSGGFTVTLPNATAVTVGAFYSVKRMNGAGGNVTVATAAS